MIKYVPSKSAQSKLPVCFQNMDVLSFLINEFICVCIYVYMNVHTSVYMQKLENDTKCPILELSTLSL